MEIFIIIAVIVVLIPLLAFLWRYLSINVLNPSGKGADAKTRKILRKYALLRNYKVLDNLTFEIKGKPVHVQNVLIGFFGLLFVETRGARGEYYGEVESPRWIFTQENKRQPIENPLYTGQMAIQAVRPALAAKKIFNIPMERVAVISNSSKKTAFYVTQTDLVFTLKKFKGYVHRSKFEEDKEVDVEKVAAVIQEYSDACKAKFPQ